MLKVEFKEDRETKSTFRFAEVTTPSHDQPLIGVIYIPKTTLKAIGWQTGKTIVLEVSAS
jgi:hypothetical protein